jgi:hypothetical protein
MLSSLSVWRGGPGRDRPFRTGSGPAPVAPRLAEPLSGGRRDGGLRWCVEWRAAARSTPPQDVLANPARHARLTRKNQPGSRACRRISCASGCGSSRPWRSSAPARWGKTTLALQLADTLPSLYLNLEAAADRARLAEPALVLERHADKLVILDEVQRLLNLFAKLRGEINAGRRQGRGLGQFLLLR